MEGRSRKAREWRELSDQSLGTHEEQKENGPKESVLSEFFNQATEAAKILDDNKLDGRAIDTMGLSENIQLVIWSNHYLEFY